MIRTIGASALALGAVLSLNGVASAGDDVPTKSSFGTTMTLGGQATAEQAAGADDTELTHYYRGGYGGYRGGYYGGYRGGYWGGYRGGYYGGYGGYRGYYGGGYRNYGLGYGYGGWGGYRGGYYGGLGYSSYYSSYSYAPVYYGGYGYGNACYYGINGNAADADAPVVSLNMAVAKNPIVARETAAPAPVGGLRYDGGPANPVPEAAPSSQAAQPAGLPVSLTKSKSPYTYKAYGEK